MLGRVEHEAEGDGQRRRCESGSPPRVRGLRRSTRSTDPHFFFLPLSRGNVHTKISSGPASLIPPCDLPSAPRVRHSTVGAIRPPRASTHTTSCARRRRAAVSRVIDCPAAVCVSWRHGGGAAACARGCLCTGRVSQHWLSCTCNSAELTSKSHRLRGLVV